MSGWLQVAVAITSLIGGGFWAAYQFRKRTPPAPGPHIGEKRPGLNGFAVILRQAMDQIDQLRRENEQLRIRVAELEAQAAAKRPRPRTPKVAQKV